MVRTHSGVALQSLVYFNFRFLRLVMSTFAQKASDTVEDPVELMLKKTGCIELHYKVQVESQISIDFVQS